MDQQSYGKMTGEVSCENPETRVTRPTVDDLSVQGRMEISLILGIANGANFPVFLNTNVFVMECERFFMRSK